MHRVDSQLPLRCAVSNIVWVVQTTLPGDWVEAEVGAWSAELVENGLAACVQRERITSVYSWDDSTQSSEEWRLEMKTSLISKDTLIETILSCHPYETPQIVAWEASSTPGYSDWVQG